VENFKVGDMARYGLDYASLKAINPRLVYCSVTGFRPDRALPRTRRLRLRGAGHGRPDERHRRARRPGRRAAEGGRGGGRPVHRHVCDGGASLAALRHAERTGEGQQVDMALLDTQVAMLANLGANYLVSGKAPGRAGNAHQNIVPYQVFEVAPAADGSKDHMISRWATTASSPSSARWPAIPELATDPRFARNQDRVRNRAVLVPMLEAVMKTRSKADWLAALEAAKVPCGAINNLAEVFADPQIEARGW
jgi:crotonobetainyl-CoA:carnitine CoA-transferase CaiB-like acyl-CoA transferase